MFCNPLKVINFFIARPKPFLKQESFYANKKNSVTVVNPLGNSSEKAKEKKKNTRNALGMCWLKSIPSTLGQSFSLENYKKSN